MNFMDGLLIVRQLIADGKNWQDLVPHGTKKVLDMIDAKNRLKNL